MNLFEHGDFVLHSGRRSRYKINCDALTDADWETLAFMVNDRVGYFTTVEGVLRGGLKLAGALERFIPVAGLPGPVLIVDDVLTTGASMERQRAGRDAVGAVVFARGPCPSWVTPLFTLTEGW